MIPLTKEEMKTHCQQKVCYLWKKGFTTDMMMTMKNTIKEEIIAIIPENIEEMLMIFVI